MLRLLFDQNFDKDVLRGLQRRITGLEAITAYEAGLSEADDPALLAWAAAENRIVVTHDRKTMPAHAGDRMKAGDRVAGVFVFSTHLPIQTIINELEILIVCSEMDEWENCVVNLPL